MRRKIFRRSDPKTLCRIQTDTWVIEAYWLRSAMQTDRQMRYWDGRSYHTFSSSYISYDGSELCGSLPDSEWEINPVCRI